MKYRWLPVLIFFAVACAPFQDSPFSDQILHEEKNVNAAAVARINGIESDGVIRIAIFSDSHQNYKDLDKVIAQVNREADVDFVVNLGDVTNSSYNLEYDQFLISYLKVARPAINVIGNHDSIGAGPNIFRKIFGELNFWFESSSARFIFFNSANLENPADFKPAWLLDAVTTSAKPVYIFTHCPLIDAERFNGADEATMLAVIQHPNTKVVFNGHEHVYAINDYAGTVLAQAPRVAGEKWTLIEITGSQFEVREKNGGGSASRTLKP